MHYFPHIISDDEPCWHEFSYRADSKELIIKIHKSFSSQDGEALQTPYFLKQYRENYSITDCFRLGQGDFFGFNGCLKQFQENDFNCLAFVFPTVATNEFSACRSCQGSGKNTRYSKEDKDCRPCHGTGKKMVENWQHVDDITDSLFIIAHYLLPSIEIKSSSSQNQLFTLDFNRESKSVNEGAIKVTISQAFAWWWAKNKNLNRQELSERLRDLWVYLHGRLPSENDERFEVEYLNQGYFAIKYPGDRAGLCANNNSGEVTGGYDIYCKNISPKHDLLPILGIMAVVHDLARAERI